MAVQDESTCSDWHIWQALHKSYSRTIGIGGYLVETVLNKSIICPLKASPAVAVPLPVSSRGIPSQGGSWNHGLRRLFLALSHLINHQSTYLGHIEENRCLLGCIA